MPLVRQREAAGVPQHMPEPEPSSLPSALQQAAEALGRKRRTPWSFLCFISFGVGGVGGLDF
jgi:hypothetical protein